MAEQTPTPPNEPLDTKTRSNLSYIFTLGSMIMLGYILYMWGSKTEILTLIIGLIGGTLLGSVSGVYFGGGTATKKTDNTTPTVLNTGDAPQTTVNPTQDTPTS